MYKAVKQLNIKTKNKTPNNPNWQVTWVDISQKKTYKWPMGTLKGVQPYNHFSSVQFSHSVMSDSSQPYGAHQAPLSMGFSRQEYWCGLPCLPPGDLPNPGIEYVSPVTPALQADSLYGLPYGKPHKDN